MAIAAGALALVLVLALAAHFTSNSSTGDHGIVAKAAQILANPFLSPPSAADAKSSASAAKKDRGFLAAALDTVMDAVRAGISRLRSFFDGSRGTRGTGWVPGPDDGRNDSSSALDLEKGPADAAYPHEGVIAGRVLSDSGEALVGIGVIATAEHLFDVPAGSEVPVGDLQRRAVTDSAGHFQFDQLAAGEYRIQNVPTDAFGMAQILVRSGADSADLVLNEQRKLLVAGTVTDSRGQPLAGAVVLPQALGASGVYTDVAGRFELQMDLQKRTSRFGIKTELIGYRDRLTLLDASGASPGQPVPVHVELEPLNALADVRGVVSSAENEAPIAGQVVMLEAPSRGQWHRATTDSEGRFDLPAVETGDGYRLTVDARGGFVPYVQQGLTVDARGLQLDLKLKPDKDRELVGRIVNLAGMPVPNFQMVVRAANPPYQAMRMASDAAGQFVVQNPPQGTLVFESDASPQVRVEGVDGNANAPIELTVDTGSNEIYGMVVDERGQPVPARYVVLSWQRQVGPVSTSTTRRAAADAQGRFSFGQVGPGVHTVIVVADGYKTARVEHDPSQQGYQFVVRLEQAQGSS